MASTPAVDGPRLIVSSHAGTVTGPGARTGRFSGACVWAARSSRPPSWWKARPLRDDRGPPLRRQLETGQVRWAYDTRGRINVSPSVVGDRVGISTYAGSVLCVRKANGHELWTTYVERDTLRMESFYASPSSDGRRLFTTARSGKVVALSVSTGRCSGRST